MIWFHRFYFNGVVVKKTINDHTCIVVCCEKTMKIISKFNKPALHFFAWDEYKRLKRYNPVEGYLLPAEFCLPYIKKELVDEIKGIEHLKPWSINFF